MRSIRFVLEMEVPDNLPYREVQQAVLDHMSAFGGDRKPPWEEGEPDPIWGLGKTAKVKQHVRHGK